MNFAFIYEDDDDSIHVAKSSHHAKNQSNKIGTADKDNANNVDYFRSSNMFKKNVLSDTNNISDQCFQQLNKKRKFNDQADDSQRINNDIMLPAYSFKKSKMDMNLDNKGIIIPDVVIKQQYDEKSNLNDIFEAMDGMKFIKPNSNTEVKLKRDFSDFTNNKIPILLFTFNSSDLSYLKFFEYFKSVNIKIIGVTPEFKYYNDFTFPILLDENGTISKLLNLRDPLGGGIFSIPSVVVFNRFQRELGRIKFGYDFNVHYDASVENNLQKIITELVDFSVSI